jgi:hypothetical protein
MPEKSEKIIFALRPDSVLVGDIVLTSGSAFISFAIRTFTKSDLSHAAICTRPGMLLEAAGPGVLRRSTLGTSATRKEWIRVLRPRRPLTPNAQGFGIGECAESAYGRAYSVRGALACCFPLFGSGDDGGVFCSQVVAEAYALYGISLLAGRGPGQINPGMLLESPELEVVTDACVRTVRSVSEPDLYDAIVRTAAEDLPIDEMRMNRRAFEAIRKRLGDTLPEPVYSLPELMVWLSARSSSDECKRADPVILATLQSEGMFTWQSDFRANTRTLIAIFEWAADAAEVSEKYQMLPEIEALLTDFRDIAALMHSSLDGRRNTAQMYQTLASRTGLKTFERFAGIYNQEYSDAQRLHVAVDRMLNALKRRPPSPDQPS